MYGQTLDGARLAVWGRNELYVESIAAVLDAHGARVLLLEAPGSLAVASRRVRAVLAESPFPADLRELTSVGIPVIVMSERPDLVKAEDAEAPVTASLAKNATLADLFSAIRTAVEAPTPTEATALTPRQQDVLELLARGLDNAEIAAELGITTRTARAHVSALLERLEVANRTQAAVVAVRKGLVQPAL